MRAVIAAIFVFALSTGRAHAGSHEVSGYVCVPSSTSIQNNLYNIDIFGSPFTIWDIGATGTIVLNCAIPIDVWSPSSIELNFANNTTCSGCASDVVSVSYMKMSKSTGAITNVKTLSSASGGVNHGASETLQSTISDVYDISQYTYFLQVVMSRSTTNNGQAFLTASVW